MGRRTYKFILFSLEMPVSSGTQSIIQSFHLPGAGSEYVRAPVLYITPALKYTCFELLAAGQCSSRYGQHVRKSCALPHLKAFRLFSSKAGNPGAKIPSSAGNLSARILGEPGYLVNLYFIIAPAGGLFSRLAVYKHPVPDINRPSVMVAHTFFGDLLWRSCVSQRIYI